jgi:hypothetical protein
MAHGNLKPRNTRYFKQIQRNAATLEGLGRSSEIPEKNSQAAYEGSIPFARSSPSWT